MKNLFTLILFFSCITSTLTQNIIFSEDFNGGIPDSWVINPISAGNPDSLDNARWIWATNESLNYSDYWIDFCYMSSPTADNGFAIFDAAYLDSGGIASEVPPTGGTGSAPTPLSSELITPGIDCSELETVALSFHQSYYARDAVVKVGISTDGGQNWEYITPNLYLWNTKDYQREKIIDITAYAAQQEDVRISFLYEGYYYYWLIDDVRVSALPDVDLSLEEVLYPLSSYAQPAALISGDTIDFSVKVNNHGKTAQSDVVLKAEVKDEAEHILFQDSIFIPLIEAGTADLKIDLPNAYLPDGLEEGLYTICYKIYTPGHEDFTPVNNEAVLPFELTENLYAKDYGTYFGAIGWTAGPSRLGNQYRTGKNWTGGFKASKIITKMCCQPEINGANVSFYMYKVNDDINEDWSNFDPSTDNSLTIKGYGEYTFGEENFDEEVEIILFDALTAEEGVLLEPDTRYFLVAEFTGSLINNVFFQMSNKIDYNYRLKDNSLVAWINNTWYVFGSGPPSAGDFVPVLRMEVAMDVSDTQDDLLAASSLTIFPNPANEHINIQVDLENTQGFQITLADAKGKIIRQKVFSNMPSLNIQWDTRQIPAGIYYLRLSTNKGSRTQKLVLY
jgi:hypothetical protein